MPVLRRARALVALFLLAMFLLPVTLPAQPANPAPSETTAQEKQAPHQYSLPPDKLQRAVEYSRARYWLHFTGELYGIAVLLAILALGLSARFRNWAEATSHRRFMQAIVFVPLLMLTNDVLTLPLGVYGQHLELAFDQSVQSWPSWLWDWTKGELVEVALAIVLVYILYAVVRRSPRRWWLYFWLATLPILFTLMFLEPVVLEPMFYRFDPLAAKHAPLVEQLEKVVARGGLAIPPDRMFEMRASEKVKSLNAYVTGIGATEARSGLGHDARHDDHTGDSICIRTRNGTLRFGARSRFIAPAGAAVPGSPLRQLSCPGLAYPSLGRQMAYPRNCRLGISSRFVADRRRRRLPHRAAG